jgi:signal transduction histidine kinase
MGAELRGVYLDHVTSASVVNLRTAPAALWAARSWRATAHALVGLPVGVVTFALTGGLPVGAAYCAVWSLLYAAPGDWPLTAAFLLLTVVAPLPALWSVRSLTALQRRRFRVLLGVEIPPLPPSEGRPSARAASTWRQIAYHVLALFTGAAGAALTAAFWTVGLGLGVLLPLRVLGLWADDGWWPVTAPAGALAVAALLAAPWVARGVARTDTALARALLGPSRSEELSLRVESLARSRAEVVAATDAERRRIERDLHDGAQQRLVSLAMNLGMARAGLADTPGPARQAIEDAHDEAVQALTELREFVRGLHPAVLDDRGLDAALSGIAARAPLPVRLTVMVPERCSPVIEAIAYFVVSEALTNITKHAGATRAEVTVDRIAGQVREARTGGRDSATTDRGRGAGDSATSDRGRGAGGGAGTDRGRGVVTGDSGGAGDRLRIVVTDDGRGGAAADGDGTGLRGLAQRAASVDGTFVLHSPAGGPTTITVELPCA